MNTNDLPVTQKLAALMEAGRACNPDMKHIRKKWGDGKTYGCALTFALAAAGIAPIRGEAEAQVAAALGVDGSQVNDLLSRVMSMNDDTDATLDEIIEAVRTDALPPVRMNGYMPVGKSFLALLSDEVFITSKPIILSKTYKWVSVDENMNFISGDYAVAAPATTPAKKVRNGQGWSAPVARHAYA